MRLASSCRCGSWKVIWTPAASWLFDACRLVRQLLADAHLPHGRARARRTQYDIDIDVERGEHCQQSVCGEAGRTTLHQARDIGLRNTKPGRCGGLCQAKRLDAHGDLERQVRLDELGRSVGHAEIVEHVAPTLDNGFVLAHAILLARSIVCGPARRASAVCESATIPSSA